VMNQVGGMIKYMRKLGYQVSEVEMPSIKLPKGRLRYLSTEEEQRLLRPEGLIQGSISSCIRARKFLPTEICSRCSKRCLIIP
jgi:hypothetical protein